MKALFLLFLLVTGCTSQRISPWIEPPGKIKNAYFYSLKKGQQTWWLLGTHHWLSAEELPEVVLRTFQDVPVTVFESIDYIEGNVSSNLQRSASEQRPSALAYETLLASGITKGTIDRTSNGALCMILVRPRNLPDTMDDTLENLARKKGNKLVGLESAQSPVLEEAMASDVGACDLEKTVRQDIMKERAEIHQFLERYRAGNDSDLEVPLSDNDQRQSAFADERNKTWHPRLRSLGAKKAFIVVGDGHLRGPGGLLKFFKSEGWKVERVPN